MPRVHVDLEGPAPHFRIRANRDLIRYKKWLSYTESGHGKEGITCVECTSTWKVAPHTCGSCESRFDPLQMWLSYTERATGKRAARASSARRLGRLRPTLSGPRESRIDPLLYSRYRS